jgi:hypothetical protein
MNKCCIIALMLAASHQAMSDSLAGTYKMELGPSGKGFEMVLACETESQCTLTSVSHGQQYPFKNEQVLNSVRPVADLTIASNALTFAIQHQGQTPKQKDAIDAMRQLRPILASNPRISGCWDLNSPVSEYTLACKLADTPTDSPPLYLFTTLMAACNDVFCRYLITPMWRTY